MFLAVLLAAAIAALASVVAQARAADGAPAPTPESLALVEGRDLFEKKGCSQCHSIWGQGSGEGIVSDLGGRAAKWADVMRFAGTMWNHVPTMFRSMEERRIVRASFSPEEMTKLVTFLFFVKFVGPPGNVERGQEVFKDKLCSRCHQLAGRGGTTAPRVDDLKDVVSSFLLARALWNHGPQMVAKMGEIGLARPAITGGDIADIVASIRRDGVKHGDLELAYIESGTPRGGEEVFKAAGCRNCHSIAGQGGTNGPDLSRPDQDFNVGGVAASLWNHGPAMWAAIREAGLKVPRFGDQDMANLLVYLAYVRYVGGRGDVARGAEVFSEKSCARCHSVGGEAGKTAPDLSTSSVAASPSTWTAAMWNHAPVMEARLRELDLAWPIFEDDEMRDVLEFVRSRMPETREAP